jgi:hypothetical protein
LAEKYLLKKNRLQRLATKYSLEEETKVALHKNCFKQTQVQIHLPA